LIQIFRPFNGKTDCKVKGIVCSSPARDLDFDWDVVGYSKKGRSWRVI
jgi:hypothetical protein